MIKTFFAIVLVFLPIYFVTNTFGRFNDLGFYTGPTAGPFFVESITPEELKKDEKIKILLVPGHEANYGGAEYKNLKERDLNVDIANNLRQYLASDPLYHVVMARDKNDWHPFIKRFFDQNLEEIKKWKDVHKEEMNNLVKKNKVERVEEKIYHNFAPEEIGLRIFGLTKWANENEVDLILHIHVNDNPGKRIYSGYSIYIPEKQYSNFRASKEIAGDISERLSKYFPLSDLPAERLNQENGLIEDQELIATSKYNTAEAPSVLVEYGYIYELWMQDGELRKEILDELSFQTFLGIQDFFERGNTVNLFSDTVLLPRKIENLSSTDVAAIQLAMMKNGVYPPEGKSKNDCGIIGIVGPCTKQSIKIFQKKFSLKETGILDQSTIKKFNELYSPEAL